MPVRPSSISRIHNVLLSFLLRSKLGHGILLRSLVVVISHRYPWWKNRILKNQDGISNGARSEGCGTVQYSMYRACDTDIVILPSCVGCKHLHDAKGRRPNHCDELIPRTLNERIQWTVDISRCSFVVVVVVFAVFLLLFIIFVFTTIPFVVTQIIGL